MQKTNTMLSGESFARLYYEQGLFGMPKKRRAVMRLVDGLPNGPCTYYYRNGARMARGDYGSMPNGAGSIMVGRWDFWQADGQPMGYITHDDIGRRHGWYENFIDGELIIKGKYVWGKPFGTWLLYNIEQERLEMVNPQGPSYKHWYRDWDTLLTKVVTAYCDHCKAKAVLKNQTQ